MANHGDQVSSESSSGSGRGIYNAPRVSSPHTATTDTSPTPHPPEHVDHRMAAHVAMFCSIASEIPFRSRRNSDLDHILDRPPKVHLADKLRIGRTGEVVSWSLPDRFPAGLSTDDNSIDAATNEAAAPSAPRWPQTVVSPVSPTFPGYPPPARSPTPPGVPSFGSEEARSYDFRFGARPQVPARGESLLRRLFQRAAPETTNPRRKQRHRMIAEDGTAVLGSFPQRQSGHGAHLLGADYHPFHQRNLSHAQCDGPSTECTMEHGEERPREPGSPDSCEVPSEAMAAEATATTQPESTNPVRPDSYHTCSSRPQGTGRQGATAAVDEDLEPTQSTAPTVPQETAAGRNSQNDQSWGDVARRAKALFFCCCSGPENESGHQPNSATQDSYVTARNQVSTESQQPRSSDQFGS